MALLEKILKAQGVFRVSARRIMERTKAELTAGRVCLYKYSPSSDIDSEHYRTCGAVAKGNAGIPMYDINPETSSRESDNAVKKIKSGRRRGGEFDREDLKDSKSPV